MRITEALPRISAPRLRRVVARLLLDLFLAVIILMTLAPIFWIVATSIKDRAETFSIPPTFVPQKIFWQNYRTIWQVQPFLRYLINTSTVAVSSCLFSLVIANLAAYGFSRFRLRFGLPILMFVLLTQMFPAVLLVLPYFLMMSRAGLVNTYWALIIAHTSFALPFCTWMLRGYYNTIPRELDAAARIDGCNRNQALAHVVLPLTVPGTVATTVFSFLLSWNDFLFALSLSTDQRMYTIPVGIALFVGEYRVAWNEIMAAAVVASLPVVMLYIAMDRHLVRGLVEGSIKS